MHAWLADALDIARTRGCRGLNLEAFDTWLAAARANPRFAALPRQQELHSIAGELALTRGQPDAARLEFDRALDAWPTPQAALQQAALLASAGCYAQARDHLDHLAALQARRSVPHLARATGAMAMLHAPCCTSSVTGPTHSCTCAPPSTTTSATTAPRNADDLQTRFPAFNRKWLVLIALPLLVLALYWPGLIGGFVFDDYPNIVDNPTLKLDTLDGPAWRAAAFSSDAGSLQRPISMLSFAVNTYFAGMDPVAMKATNVVIHGDQCAAGAGPCATVVRAGGAWRRCTTPHMGRSLRRRRVGGASDQHDERAVHRAAHGEPCAYVRVRGVVALPDRPAAATRGRKRALVDRRRPVRLHRAGHPVQGVGGLLPLYAWLAEACIPALRNSPQKGDVRKLFAAVLWLPLVAGLFWLYPRITGPKAFSTRDFGLEERLLTEGRVVLDYLRWTLAPPLRELTLYHDDYVVSRGWMSPPSTLFAMLGLVRARGVRMVAACAPPAHGARDPVVLRRASADGHCRAAGTGVRASQLLRVDGCVAGARGPAAADATRQYAAHRRAGRDPAGARVWRHDAPACARMVPSVALRRERGATSARSRRVRPTVTAACW